MSHCGSLVEGQLDGNLNKGVRREFYGLAEVFPKVGKRQAGQVSILNKPGKEPLLKRRPVCIHINTKTCTKYSLTNNVLHSHTVCNTESLHIPLNTEATIQEDSLVQVA